MGLALLLTVPTARAQSPLPPGVIVVGTIIVEAEDRSMAVITDQRSGRQRLHRVGDVVGSVRIKRILPDKVVFSGSDGDVEVRLTSGPGLAPPPEPSAAMPEAARPIPPPSITLDRATLARLSQEATGQASDLEGHGVRLDHVPANGVLSGLGLVAGDIVRDVNGKIPGRGLSFAEALVDAAATSPSVRVHIERGGYGNSIFVPVRR